MTKKIYMQPETVAIEMDGAASICVGSLSKDPAKGDAQSLGDEDAPVCVSFNDEE